MASFLPKGKEEGAKRAPALIIIDKEVANFWRP